MQPQENAKQAKPKSVRIGCCAPNLQYTIADYILTTSAIGQHITIVVVLCSIWKGWRQSTTATKELPSAVASRGGNKNRGLESGRTSTQELVWSDIHASIGVCVGTSGSCILRGAGRVVKGPDYRQFSILRNPARPVRQSLNLCGGRKIVWHQAAPGTLALGLPSGAKLALSTIGPPPELYPVTKLIFYALDL